MIIDSLENAGRYTSIHPLFAEAFEYIKTLNLKNTEIGKTDLSDGLKIIVAENLNVIIKILISSFALVVKNKWAGNHESLAARQRENITQKRMYYFITMLQICFLN